MPRRPRLDRPGLLHHIFNRGLARRTVFEGRTDVRRFLLHLARLVREGLLEVHAYCVLTTHFHLLVRSVDGEVSEAMRRLQNFYVRDFNRARRRDGPLFRGRFGSIPVESVRYVHALVRYIDRNAVQAGLVSRGVNHPYGSAQYHAGLRRPPPWLSSDVVGAFLTDAPEGTSRAEAYERAFPSASPALARFVERRISSRARSHDPLDVFLGAPGTQVLGWMTRKADLGDGTRPGICSVDPDTVCRVVSVLPHLPSRIRVGPKHERPPTTLLIAALLRDLAGESLVAIGRRFGVAGFHASRFLEEHSQLLQSSPEYGAWIVRAAEACLEETLGSFPWTKDRVAALSRAIGSPPGSCAIST